MKIEQRPIEGVLVITCDNGHKAVLDQGTIRRKVNVIDGTVTIKTKGFKAGGAEVLIIDEHDAVLDSSPIVLQRAFSVDPTFTKRGGTVYLDLNETVKLSTMQVIKYTIRNKDRSVNVDKIHRDMVVSSQSFECRELIGYSGELKVTVQAYTRKGESYIKTFEVTI